MSAALHSQGRVLVRERRYIGAKPARDDRSHPHAQTTSRRLNMSEGSLNPSHHFVCGLRRPNLQALHGREDPLLTVLRAVKPPKDIAHVHDADHLAAFTQHVRNIVARPVEIRAIDGQRYVHILGQAVFERGGDGQYRLFVWWQPSGNEPWALYAIEIDRTPVIDFPRTPLWKQNLRDMLLEEAARRISDSTLAIRWADWAWSWVHFKVIAMLDIRRLRAQVRGALDLNLRALSLLRFRRRSNLDLQWTMNDYNDAVREVDEQFVTTMLCGEMQFVLPQPETLYLGPPR